MKNYSIRFYCDRYDFYEKNGDKYYLIAIEDENKKITSKFVKANTNRELTLIKELVLKDRLVVCYYIESKEEKYIDNIINDCHELVQKLVKGDE